MPGFPEEPGSERGSCSSLDPRRPSTCASPSSRPTGLPRAVPSPAVPGAFAPLLWPSAGLSGSAWPGAVTALSGLGRTRAGRKPPPIRAGSSARTRSCMGAPIPFFPTQKGRRAAQVPALQCKRRPEIGPWLGHPSSQPAECSTPNGWPSDGLLKASDARKSVYRIGHSVWKRGRTRFLHPVGGCAAGPGHPRQMPARRQALLFVLRDRGTPRGGC